MKRVAYSLVFAVGLASTSTFAADMAVKAPPAAAAPATPVWDIAISSALMSDYNFRGVTQSDHKPSAAAGFEPRYNFNKDLQGYVGISGESIDFPNRAAAEIDFYGGFRPTFDKLALDFGFWYYYYPGGQCFNVAPFCSPTGAIPVPTTLPNGNVVKKNVSFEEWYGKATYTVNDNLAFGIQEWYSPSVLNSGATGWYTVGNLTLTAPTTWFTNGVGAYVSGDAGYWKLGTSDSFYGVVSPLGNFAAGIPYKSYWNWDAGLGFTWKAFTLDLRYYGTNLNKGDCNAFTSDHTASGIATTPINPGLAGSNWCSAAYIAKLSFATNLSNIK